MTLNFFLPFIITLTGGAKKVPTVIFDDVASRRHQGIVASAKFSHKPIDFSSFKRPQRTSGITYGVCVCVCVCAV